MKKKIDKQDTCYEHKSIEIGWHEIEKKFGSIYEKKLKVHEFFKREKTDVVIPVEELEKHHSALFQTIHNNGFQDYSFNDVLIDFQVDKEKGIVKAKKLFKFMQRYFLETRIYYIENYGKTWRAWAALPTRASASRWD